MAIYRTGQASMDANGYITGYGTKWKTALTLIRPGATIVFASNPVAYATISEIVSDTSLRAISSGGAVVPKGDYVILLHDSLTVDGLAQDVAETLRYYQGQETMYQEFVEFLKGFDWQRMEQLGEKAYADAKAAEASANAAKASETNANASKNAAAGSATTASQKATEAANSAGAAKTSETNANASKTAAANSAAAAASSATTAGQHKDAAAASASAARTSEGNASSSKNAAAASASAAKTSETNAKASEASATASKNAAKTSEDNAAASKNAAASSASAAAGSATTAKQQADRAKDEADRAQSANPDNQLKKANNLSDVPDKAKARENLSLSRHKESSIETLLESSDINKKLYLSAPNDTWGFFDYAAKKHIALPVGAGGTGATDAAGARVNLDVPGRSEVGMSIGGNIQDADANNVRYNGFFTGAGDNAKNYARQYGPGIVLRRTNDVYQIQPDTEGHLHVRSYTNSTWSNWVRNIIPGDYGIGVPATTRPGSDWGSMFISDNDGANSWAPSNGGGIQSSYANNRAAQIWVDYAGRLYSRFNASSSPQASSSSYPWKRALNPDDVGIIIEKAGGNLGETVSLDDVSLRGNGHGVYYQPMSANATQANGYPVQMAGSFRVEQNGANGANGCAQFYTPYMGVGGTYFRFVSPDGNILSPGGTGGWKMNLTNNGDVCGGRSPTITDYNNFTSNHVGFGYGANVSNSTNTGGIVNTISNGRFSDYKSMSCHDYASGRLFFRTFNADSVKSWTPWKEVTFLASSDINLKEVKGNLNVNGALDNVCRMEFKLFRYLSDESERSARRGVIAQQVQKIDREYVKQVGDYLHLDQTPMLLDGLAAIKALKKLDDDNKQRIAKLEGEVEELKAMVAALIAK
nr:MAG TPA: tail protein [Bacteriophage sp.]